MIITTLGDNAYPSTCSYLAAQKQYPGEKIILLDSFEACLESLKIGNSDISIIPAAYPKLNSIIMDDNFEINNTFIHKIPDLVLSCKYNENEFSCLYYHIATQILLKKISKSYKNKQLVNSNTEAALKVKSSSSYDLCITNRFCAEQQSLIILQILRKELKMPFLCFSKKEKK